MVKAPGEVVTQSETTVTPKELALVEALDPFNVIVPVVTIPLVVAIRTPALADAPAGAVPVTMTFPPPVLEMVPTFRFTP